jgi:hypothetical protein
MSRYVISPKTGREILVGGSTYLDLASSPKWQDKLVQMPIYLPDTSKPVPMRRGCSNQGKYKGIPEHLFCGPEGGSCPGTYPVNTPGRARAALSYARFAPNPQGIRDCAKRVAKQKGWSK